MVNIELVRRKLNKIIEYLEELKGIEDYSFQDYLDNYFIKRTTERLIQLIVEIATDINGHIIVDNGYLPPKTYYESFLILSELGVISREFAKEIAPSTGLRNRLIHEYEEIDDEIVYKSVSSALRLYKEYIKKVEKYLGSK
ncbi:MAG: DUF86 domain-containing protein [Halanaerobiaceae bacterium]|nr:DUF86 domain-containing protein [Halanaerobiaceae bacterium]